MVAWEWLLFAFGLGVGALAWAYRDKKTIRKALDRIRTQEETEMLDVKEETRILKERIN